MPESLLAYKKNVFSQNGEDGIIEYIFSVIDSDVNRVCCEFGAWDGIHLSNVRNLILQGWTAIMIEGEKDRLNELKLNYKENPNVFGINAFVDTEENSLTNLLKANGVGEYGDKIDFLSIDIDGLDYYIFESLELRPKVICIEATSAHDPSCKRLLEKDMAIKSFGQPLGCITEQAHKKGYMLVCYTGNAFYIRNDVAEKYGFKAISDIAAYKDFLLLLSAPERRWLYAVNLGLGEPFYEYKNPYLSRESLGLSFFAALYLCIKYTMIKSLKRVRSLIGAA